MPDKQDTAKQAAARHAATFVQDGMIVGLGTGSTAFYALEALAQRVREGLKIQGVPTSLRTEALARGFGIPLLKDYPSFDRVDLTIDGADEVDPSFCAIKGGGGALTREKIIAAASERMVVMVDESKVVAKLGKFPLAVEVLQMGWRVAVRRLEDLGCQAALRRQDDGQPFLTDNGHYIVDCKFGEISAPQELEREINCIPGVVENGLFVGLVDAVVVGFPDGRVEVRPAEGSGR